MFSKNTKTGGRITMMNKKMNKGLLKVVERITRIELDKNSSKRPPFCAGIYHQPKRPKN
jgi:cyclic lactone autoinducer peptide